MTDNATFQALKAGDLIEATYDYPDHSRQYTIRATIWAEKVTTQTSLLRIGPRVLRWPDGNPGAGLVDFLLLESASEPFYTNAPADRQPRIADVAAWRRREVTRWIFLGAGWALASEQPTPHPARVSVVQFKPGELALVDPAELAQEGS